MRFHPDLFPKLQTWITNCQPMEAEEGFEEVSCPTGRRREEPT